MKREMPKGGVIAIVIGAVILAGVVIAVSIKDVGTATGPGIDKEIEQANATKARYENMQNESKQYGRPENASPTGAAR